MAQFSLRTKLTLWNAALFLVSFLIFGGLQIWLATRSAEQVLDQSLIARAEGAHRGGPFLRGPLGGGMGGPPEEGPGGEFGQLNGGPPEAQPNGQNGLGQNGQRQNGLGQNNAPQGQNGPPNETPGSPSFFRRPSIIHPPSDATVQPPNDQPWSPNLVPASLKGETKSGYVEVQGTKLRVLSRPFRRPDGKYDVIQVVQDATGIEIARQSQVLSMLSALPIVILISWILSFVLTRMVLVPVAKLTSAAEDLAKNPGSKGRIQSLGNDEMGRLSDSFNQMTDQMQLANSQLAESLEKQQRFTSDAAHELRTPLTSIALAAENGLHASASEAERIRSLEIIDRSATSLRRLTDILLSLARIDAGKQAMPLSEISLKSIVSDAIEISGLNGDDRIKNEISEEDSKVLGNADAMRQIMTNLITNAAAATADDGFIVIAKAGATLRVQDSGVGVAAEHLPHLFDRFYRVDTSRTRTSGGFGLGLAITKALVEAQGATISVSSRIGAGTTFSIEFQVNQENS